jgi:hypothetical protein
MNDIEKAEIIMKGIETYISIPSGFEDFYIKGILIGLKQIRDKEGKLCN